MLVVVLTLLALRGVAALRAPQPLPAPGSEAVAVAGTPCEVANRDLREAGAAVAYALTGHVLDGQDDQALAAVQALRPVEPSAPARTRQDIEVVAGSLVQFVAAHRAALATQDVRTALAQVTTTFQSDAYTGALERVTDWLDGGCST